MEWRGNILYSIVTIVTVLICVHDVHYLKKFMIRLVGSQFILSQLYAHVAWVVYILSFLPPFQFVSTTVTCVCVSVCLSVCL